MNDLKSKTVDDWIAVAKGIPTPLTNPLDIASHIF